MSTGPSTTYRPRRPFRPRSTALALLVSASLPAPANAHQAQEAPPAQSGTPETSAPTSPATATGELAPGATPGQAAPQAAPAKLYTPSDFARFSPTTALEMVNRIPGFALQTVDERRGLGEATGNVVINGKRVSGKSNDSVTELGRIPAAKVVRIEIVDAASLDVPGLSGQVANVITSATGAEGSFEWTPFYRPKIRVFDPWAGSLSGSVTRGPLTFNLGVDNNQAYAGGGIGPERALDPQGNLVDLRNEDGHFRGDLPRLTGSMKYDRGLGGVVANLNGFYQRNYTSNVESSLRSGPGLPDRDQEFAARERSQLYEVGGDHESPLGGGRLKLIALRRGAHMTLATQITTALDGALRDGIRYGEVTDTSETIGRGEYRWRAGGASWQVSAEGALNTLANAVQYAELAPGGGYVSVPIAGTDAEVKERRAEAILSYGRPLGRSVQIRAAVGAEYSNLRQTGPGGLDRTFYRPKGSLSLAWKASARLDVNAKVERRVGQLDFGDFLASRNVLGGTENAGNPELVPEQSWDAEVEAARSFGRHGSLRLRPYARLISDLVDIIPIGDTGESRGNIPSASIYGLQATTTVNFDPFGWRGARLDAVVQIQNSRLRDPLSLLPRPISTNLRRRLDLRFRDDLPGSKLSFGLNYVDRRNFDTVRLGEYANLYSPASLDAYVEHRDVLGLKVRATVGNVLGTDETYTRYIYAGRRTGQLARVEARTRAYGPEFRLSISGQI